MGLFPRKYCKQTHSQSQLYQRQKMIFYNDKLIYNQNLKFYSNNFTEFTEILQDETVLLSESGVTYTFQIDLNPLTCSFRVSIARFLICLRKIFWLLTKSLRHYATKIRTSILPLRIQTGRYAGQNIPRN